MGDRATLGDLRPPLMRLRPLASSEEFFKAADETRARVDRARLKEPTGPQLTDSEWALPGSCTPSGEGGRDGGPT